MGFYRRAVVDWRGPLAATCHPQGHPPPDSRPAVALLLLERGAAPIASAIAQCAASGSADSADLIKAAYVTRDDDLPAAYEAARTALLHDMVRQSWTAETNDRRARLMAFNPA